MLSAKNIWFALAFMMHISIGAQQLPVFGYECNAGQLSNQHGQPNDEVLFIYRSAGFNLQLRATGISYDLYKYENVETTLDASEKYSGWLAADTEVSFHRIDVNFVNPSSAMMVIGQEPLPLKHTYQFNHRGSSFVETAFFEKVIYQNIYEGIDLEFVIGEESQPKFNYIIHPGADYGMIALDYLGADFNIADGQLRFETSLGSFSEKIPLSYLQSDAQRNDLHFEYSSHGKRVAFRTDSAIDPDETLVIDPLPNVAWSTYCGSTGGDIFYITMTDNSGNVFAVGRTLSAANIATAGAYQTAYGGNIDGMLSKYDSNGARLWGTYIGGAFTDVAWSMDIDSSGNIYICGTSSSSTSIATAGTQQPTKQAGADAFLMKFSPAGTLTWGTYMGYSGEETAYSLVIRNDTEIYMCGETSSTSNIATGGVVQPGYGGGTKDAFMARYNASGFRTWCSFYGGSLVDVLYSIDVHIDGTLVAGGYSTSTNAIATAGGYQTASGGSSDGFLVCVNSTGTVRNWATYFGGGGTESVTSVDIDVNMYVVYGGNTASSTGVATAGASQTVYGGVQDAFVGMLYLTGGTMQWATYIGGTLVESLFGVVTDGWGYVYAVGSTSSNTNISTVDATQPTYGGGGNDGFMVIFGHVGFKQWGTYFGGADNDAVLYIWPITGPGAYICGATVSSTGIATPGAAQTVFGGSGFQDAFLTKLQDLILPVEFAAFEASVTNDNYVICEWTTASETNNDFFEVERSTDNLNFEKIGTIAGAGTTLTEASYQFEDKSFSSGWLYYRIRQVDYNGESTLSTTEAVLKGLNGELMVFPNPVVDVLRVPMSELSVLHLYDASGCLVLVHHASMSSGIAELDISTFPSGFYQLVLIHADSKKQSARIIKP
ncbi:MAG: SBBP repeat-containing protein [Flavobacteriales bacterium]